MVRKITYQVILNKDGSTDVRSTKKEAREYQKQNPLSEIYEAVVVTDEKLNISYKEIEEIK